MTFKKHSIFSWGLLFALSLNPSTGHTSLSPEQENAVKKMIAEYIKQNPGDILSTLETHIKKKKEEKEAAQLALFKNALETHKPLLFDPSLDVPFIGTEKISGHGMTWSLFVDPFCGYCHKLMDNLQKLCQSYPHVRINLRLIPLYGDISRHAIKALWAAHQQKGFWPYWHLLRKEENLEEIDKSRLILLAKKANLNSDKFAKDWEDDSFLESSHKLATTLGVEETPTLIWPQNKRPGYMSLKDLTLLLQELQNPEQSASETPASKQTPETERPLSGTQERASK